MRKLLDCTGLMMFTLGFQIRLMGFLGRCVITNPVSFSVNRNAGSPFVLIPDHAQKTRFIASVWPTNILRVAVRCNDAQIAQSVVVFAPVNVVNQSGRPFVVRIQPCKPVRFVNFLFDTYRNIAKSIRRTCNIADMNGFSGPHDPGKNSRIGVVMEQLTKFFRRNVVCHVCSPFWRFNVNAGIIA